MAPYIDFAISYAGEDEREAAELNERLKELGLTTFFAGEQRHELVGADGESFFEYLFSEAKVVVAFISEAYRRKEWTRFEWDVIRARPHQVRFVPVRLDQTNILGLPSNVMYTTFDGDWEPIVRTCITHLLRFEHKHKIERPTEFQTIVESIRESSRGALAQAYQLVKDQRVRDPLGPVDVPGDNEFERHYQIASTDWHNFSTVRRLSLKVELPATLTPEEIRSNLKHCCASAFNDYRPDAVAVLGYLAGTDLDGPFTAGRMEFAPFGDWSRAQDGVAYNIPVSEFDYRYAPARRSM